MEPNRLVLLNVSAVKSSSCPYGDYWKNLDTVWKYFVNNYRDDETLVIEEVNCDLDRQLTLTKYKIEHIWSYPAIFFFRGGEAFVYQGIYAISFIENFLKSPEKCGDASRLIYCPKKNLFCEEKGPVDANLVNDIDWSIVKYMEEIGD